MAIRLIIEKDVASNRVVYRNPDGTMMGSTGRESSVFLCESGNVGLHLENVGSFTIPADMAFDEVGWSGASGSLPATASSPEQFIINFANDFY